MQFNFIHYVVLALSLNSIVLSQESNRVGTFIGQNVPTSQPTSIPTAQPSSEPTSFVTPQPSTEPKSISTSLPTTVPISSFIPSHTPSHKPNHSKVVSHPPTFGPSDRPSRAPFSAPSKHTITPNTHPSRGPATERDLIISEQYTHLNSIPKVSNNQTIPSKSFPLNLIIFVLLAAVASILFFVVMYNRKVKQEAKTVSLALPIDTDVWLKSSSVGEWYISTNTSNRIDIVV